MVSLDPAESGTALDVDEKFELVELVDVAVEGENALLAMGPELAHHPITVDYATADVDGFLSNGGRGAVVADGLI